MDIFFQKRDYRLSYEEEIAKFEKDINEYTEKGEAYDDSVNSLIYLLEGIKSMGKKNGKKQQFGKQLILKNH